MRFFSTKNEIGQQVILKGCRKAPNGVALKIVDVKPGFYNSYNQYNPATVAVEANGKAAWVNESSIYKVIIG